MLSMIQKEELKTMLPQGRVAFDEPLAPLTSFGIGGPADVLVRPGTVKELAALLQFTHLHSLPWFILGKGTNLLIRDKGIRGVVVQLAGEFVQIFIVKTHMTVGGGVLLSEAAARAARSGLTGLEFAHGIPGTMGGAVMMNAGAYGGEMKDLVFEVETMAPDGTIAIRTGPEMAFGYRACALQGTACIVTRVDLELEPGEPERIRARTEDLQRRRWDKQPLNIPSAGSFFKRPPGHYAGKLIEDAGLKGFRIGGAQISEKHAGFIVNRGDATSEDVIAVMKHVQETVLKTAGVVLETEIRIVGEE